MTAHCDYCCGEDGGCCAHAPCHVVVVTACRECGEEWKRDIPTGEVDDLEPHLCWACDPRPACPGCKSKAPHERGSFVCVMRANMQLQIECMKDQMGLQVFGGGPQKWDGAGRDIVIEDTGLLKDES